MYEELDRISLDRKKPSHRELCYAAFKAAKGEKAHEILTTFQGIQQVTESKKQTVAQRTRAFKQYSARVTNLMDSFETHHGFSGAVILVGDSVNSDGHLATVHMTEHAEGFFEDKCRAPSDVLIGHMKSHVYNRVSNAMIDFTWDGEPEAGTSTPAKGKQRASDKHVKAASQHQSTEASRGGTSSARPEAASPIKAAQSEDDEDLLIVRALSEHDGAVADISVSSGNIDVVVNASLFPWKTLPQVLAANGAWMDNWPDDVPWPGEPADKQTNSRRPTKGITTLKSAEINALLASLKAPIHRIRFHKCQNDHEKLDLRGRRLFANGKTDRQGHPRLERTDSGGGCWSLWTAVSRTLTGFQEPVLKVPEAVKPDARVLKRETYHWYKGFEGGTALAVYRVGSPEAIVSVVSAEFPRDVSQSSEQQRRVMEILAYTALYGLHAHI
ncbi:hypothetical protein NUW54_g3257 [Trametes sanguinea]|uniref:Uncharacterized protein n=1 Tax=Trametes sanguinea TaxID=158606 RepID=A0ACC1Q4W5_9APHY|nr:hypothetical protein NUW54_g3257 [Trametes sanguinea]